MTPDSRASQIIAFFQNSPLIAPLIAFGVVVIALASFTDAIKKLATSLGLGSPVFVASAGGPRFDSPRLNERTIDGCLLTMKSQVADDPYACNGPAQMEIATEFCKVAHHKRAANFQTKFFPTFQNSYKLSQTLTSDGEVKHAWNTDDRGGYIFISIDCEKWHEVIAEETARRLLHLVRRIRNEFAHNPDAAFDDPRVSSWVNEIPERERLSDPKKQFTLASVELIADLEHWAVPAANGRAYEESFNSFYRRGGNREPFGSAEETAAFYRSRERWNRRVL